MTLYVCLPKTFADSDPNKVEIRSFPREGERILGTIEMQPFFAFAVMGPTCGVRVDPVNAPRPEERQ